MVLIALSVLFRIARLLAVARSHDVDCWWVRTLLLRCTGEDDLTAEDATKQTHLSAPTPY